MKLKDPNPASVILMLILAVAGCRSGQQPPAPPQELYAAFQSIAPTDTLAVRLDTVAGDSGRVVPAALFLAAVDSLLIGKMIYEPDTFDFQGRAYWKFALDENFDACLIGIEQVWFHFKYLLIYSKPDGSFVGIVPAAFLYGGDGGQLMSESWIYDLKSNPTILSRFLEHALRWSETDPDEPESISIQSVGRKQWSGGEFIDIPVQDSSSWIQRYPLSWE